MQGVFRAPPANYCLHVSERESDAKSIAHSVCRWKIVVIYREPVAMRRPTTAPTPFPSIAELNTLEDQTGTVYRMRK